MGHYVIMREKERENGQSETLFRDLYLTMN